MKSIGSKKDYEELNTPSKTVHLTEEEQKLMDEYGPMLNNMDQKTFIESLKVSATGRLTATQQGLMGLFEDLKKNPIDNRAAYLYLPGPAGDHGAGDMVNMLHVLSATRRAQLELKKAETEESLAAKLAAASSRPVASAATTEAFLTEPSDYQEGGAPMAVAPVTPAYDETSGSSFANGAKTPEARLAAINSYLKDHAGKHGYFVFDTEKRKMFFDEHDEEMHKTYEAMPHPELRKHMEDMSSESEVYMALPGMVHMVYKDAINHFVDMAKQKMLEEPSGEELPSNVAETKKNPLAHHAAKDAVANTLFNALNGEVDLTSGSNVEALAEALTPDLNMAFETDAATVSRMRDGKPNDSSAAARIARLREKRNGDAKSGAAVDAAAKPVAEAPSAHSLLVHTFSGINSDPTAAGAPEERVQHLGDFMGELRQKFGDDEAHRIQNELKAATKSSVEAMGLSFEGATNMANGDVHGANFKMLGYRLNPKKDVTVRNAAFRVAPNAKNAPKAAPFSNVTEVGYAVHVTGNDMRSVHPITRKPVTLKKGDTLYSSALVLDNGKSKTLMIATPLEAVSNNSSKTNYHSKVVVPGTNLSGHMQTADSLNYDAAAKQSIQDSVKVIYFN